VRVRFRGGLDVRPRAGCQARRNRAMLPPCAACQELYTPHGRSDHPSHDGPAEVRPPAADPQRECRPARH